MHSNLKTPIVVIVIATLMLVACSGETQTQPVAKEPLPVSRLVFIAPVCRNGAHRVVTARRALNLPIHHHAIERGEVFTVDVLDQIRRAEDEPSITSVHSGPFASVNRRN